MNHICVLMTVFTLGLTACSVEFNPPPLSMTAPVPEATETPLVLLATPTFTAIPPTAPLPTATMIPPTAPAATATESQPTPTVTRPTLSVDQLRNATFTMMGSDRVLRTISLKDGKYQNGTDPAQPGYVLVTLGDKIAFGDLNGDGFDDAAISVAENFGGSGDFVSVVAVINQAGQPNPVASELIDDRPVMNQLEIQNGEIFVDALVHGPADAMCCAALPSKRSYRLIDNALVLSQLSTTTENGIERVILIETPGNGTEISGPFIVKGSVSISPFENTLGYKVFIQGSKQPLAQAGFVISADGLGGPGTFELPIDAGKIDFKGAVRIEISDVSAADGSNLAVKTIFLVFK
jgi:hypothetical protein